MSGSWSTSILNPSEHKLAQEIDRIPEAEVLKANLAELAATFAEDYQLEVPQLDESGITQAQPREAKVDARELPGRFVRDSTRPIMVNAIAITFSVPFTGDQGLFRLKASTFSMNPPQATVGQRVLEFTYKLADPKAGDIKKAFQQELELIKQCLGWVARDVEPFNTNLVAETEKLLTARRDRLRQKSDLAAELGYPLKQREDAPQTYAVPTKRRQIRAKRPETGTTPSPLEPALLDADYEHILETLQKTAQVMEYSPHAFRTMGEEDLRWLFMIPLNLAYEGGATGETFNYEGKTDILIRAEGRNIFIGECLIWNGPAYLTKKLDQLLGYTSWRDTKTALLVFNRRRNFTQVVEKIAPTIENHPNFLRVVPVAGETTFRFVVSHRDDPEREVLLTVLCFDVPSER